MKMLIAIKCFFKVSVKTYVGLLEYEVAALELDSIWHSESSFRYQANNFTMSVHNFKIACLNCLI